MDLPVCRVCLTCDISHSVRDVPLRETYERLAGAKFYSPDELPVPVTLCYYCYWQLRKFSSFAAQVRSSHKILKEAIKCGAKVGLKYIQNLPKKCHLTISTTKIISLDDSIKRKSCTDNLKKKVKKVNLSSLELHLAGNPDLIIIKQKKPEKLEGEIVQINNEIETDHNEKLRPNKIQVTENNAQSLLSLESHLTGNPEMIIKKQKKPEHFGEIVQINTEYYLKETEHNKNEKLRANKIQSTENNAQSLSSLESHLAGNPELIIIKQKKPGKFGEIVQINTEKETEHNENEKLRPNKIQSTENNAQSLSSLESHLAGNPELIIKKQKNLAGNPELIIIKQKKPGKIGEIVQINTEIETEHNENEKLRPNKIQSTENNAQSVSSLDSHLAGNLELIIQKQNKPEKFGEIVQIHTEIETEHNDNEKLRPNKIQSTENNAQSLSSLDSHLAGNPEFIIKKQKNLAGNLEFIIIKQKKPGKFGEIVQINTKIETEHNDNEKLRPKKKQSTVNNAHSVSSLDSHLAGNLELIIQKQNKPEKFGEIVQIHTEIETEHNDNEKLRPNKIQSTENNAQSLSSLDSHLAGNPEFIIKKQKKTKKLKGDIVQNNSVMETEHTENENLSPNKIQSTENNAQSEPQMIEEYLDFDYDYDRYDETYPCHESQTMFSTEKYLAKPNKKRNNKKRSNLKETKIVAQTSGIIKRKKKDMNGINQSGEQVFMPVADNNLDIQNLNMVAEFLEIETDSDLQTNLIVNNADTIDNIEENIDHQDTHNNNTQSETQSIGNVLENCDIEIKEASQSKNIDGASKHDNTTLENDTNKLIYKCNFCNKVCTTKENLDEHKQAHTMSGIDKKFACKECGQKFACKFFLEEHIRRHTNERPFTCEICGKSFMTGGHLDNHKFQVHSKTKHVCKLCNKSFKSKGYLYNYHLNIHFNVRPFVCHICKRAFHQSGALWEHIRNVHQGMRRYACDICGSKHYTKPKLARHMITHSGIKAFSCEYCNMDFATKATMRRHVVQYCKMK